MSNSIICEGKTTEQALENGLKILKVSKDKVNIKVLDSEDKRSFFSILSPRIVKLELTLKEGVVPNNKAKPEKTQNKRSSSENSDKDNNHSEKVYNHDEKELKAAKEQVKQFMDEFVKKLPSKDIKVECSIKDFYIFVNITGTDVSYLIGYRGETLNALQLVLSSIINKRDSEKIRVVVDIEGYRGKREQTLVDLAEKISKTVVRTGKSITLEPMSSYERKIIHSRLQGKEEIKTYSIGEEPYRKIVVTLK